ncbi:MAG: hypothetical protein ACOYYU_21085 [Chloroflexota bacterium]
MIPLAAQFWRQLPALVFAQGTAASQQCNCWRNNDCNERPEGLGDDETFST